MAPRGASSPPARSRALLRAQGGIATVSRTLRIRVR